MIQVRNLSFAYAKTAAPAIRDLEFTVGRGEIFGFLGPSGAGKSTTQNILTGLLRNYQGSVRVLGRDLGAWDSGYYEQIGVCFEFPNHFLKLTARENLRYFASLFERPSLPAGRVLDMVGLGEDAGTPVARFSKGMKTRLTLARALQHDPQLLFLDEPTGGLDPATARRIKNLIAVQKEAGKTIFLSTHDMQVADELCDRLAFIVDGRIRLISSPRELKRLYGQARVRVEVAVDGHSRRREFPLSGLGRDEAFLSLLRSGQVETLHTLEASLEDVFIQVTGRSLHPFAAA